MSRYRLPLDLPHLGERLVAKTGELKLHLFRFKDRDGDTNILLDYELRGHLRPDSTSPEDVALLRALMAEFTTGQPPESLDLGDDEEGGDHE